MGRLTDLLKTNPQPKKQPKVNSVVTIESSIIEPKIDDSEILIGTLTQTEYEIVQSQVESIDMIGKNRREIIIGVYGNIKNPKTNDRFVIPNLVWSTEDYVYEYSKYMKTLINRPEEFTKVMGME